MVLAVYPTVTDKNNEQKHRWENSTGKPTVNRCQLLNIIICSASVFLSCHAPTDTANFAFRNQKTTFHEHMVIFVQTGVRCHRLGRWANNCTVQYVQLVNKFKGHIQLTYSHRCISFLRRSMSVWLASLLSKSRQPARTGGWDLTSRLKKNGSARWLAIAIRMLGSHPGR